MDSSMRYALFLLLILSGNAAFSMNTNGRRNNHSVRDDKRTSIKRTPAKKKLSVDQLLELAIKKADEIEKEIIAVNKDLEVYLAREALINQLKQNR